MKSAPTIAFEYRPSRRVLCVLVLVAVLAGTAPWLSALPWMACLAATLAICAVALQAGHGFMHPPIARIAHRGDGWVLIDAQGNEQGAQLRGHRHLGTLITLDWRCAGGARMRAVLAGDNLDADTRRRLIVLLRRVAHAQAPALTVR